MEMKPIMGFLSICFILALNARPPLTPRMEFYCGHVHGHRGMAFGKERVKEKERKCLWAGGVATGLSAQRGIFGAVVHGRGKNLTFKHRSLQAGRCLLHCV